MRTATLVFLATAIASAQPNPTTFRSDARLVHIDAEVRERGTGRAIDVLGPNDFLILDEGERREVKVFEIGTTPLDVVFLLYTDGWVHSPNDMKQMLVGLRYALKELHPGDRAAVLRKDSSSNADVPLTEDLVRVESALLRMRGRASLTGRGNRLYDAVLAAVGLFPKPHQRGRRRAIVAITDDIETKSKTKLNGLIAEILEADATLNAAIVVTGQMYVGITGRTIPIPGVPNPGGSRRIGGTNPQGDSIEPAVEASGGELVPGDKFRDEFPRMLRRIRGRFLLGFYAPPAKERRFRKIEVKLTDEARARYPDAVIRARSGYYAHPEPGN